MDKIYSRNYLSYKPNIKCFIRVDPVRGNRGVVLLALDVVKASNNDRQRESVEANAARAVMQSE